MGFGLSLLVEVIGGIVTALILGLGAAFFAASQRVRNHDGRIEDLYEDNRRWFRDRDRDLGIAKDQLAEQAADRGLIGGGALRQGGKKKQRQALHDYRDEISAKRRRYRELRGAEGKAEELVRRQRSKPMRRFELTDAERAILASWRTNLDPPDIPGAVVDPTSEELEPDIRRFEEHGDPARRTQSTRRHTAYADCVPKRTNTFQEVVSIIHGDLAGEATREDSAMLTNRLTGEQREVDVVLRATVAGHETAIAVEATSRRSPVTAPWGRVDGRQARQPADDKLVLVSESGFTKQARALAEAQNVAAITPEDITGDDRAAAIMEAFPSLKPKTVELGADPVKVAVTRPDGTRGWFKAPENMDLVLDDGETIWSVERYVLNEITTSSNDLMESIDLANIIEDAYLGVEIRIEPPFTVDGKETGLRARYLDDGVEELHQVDGFLLDAKAQVRVCEIKLTHKKLADLDVTYAYGEGSVHGLPALAVVSQGPHGQKVTITVRGEAP